MPRTLRQRAFDVGESIHEEEARAFDLEHPVVRNLVRTYTFEAIAAGLARVSFGAVWERVRWHLYVTPGFVDLKLNNNHRSYFARRFIEENPDRARIFETRRLRSREWTR